jgi:hypothetical protein
MPAAASGEGGGDRGEDEGEETADGRGEARQAKVWSDGARHDAQSKRPPGRRAPLRGRLGGGYHADGVRP